MGAHSKEALTVQCRNNVLQLLAHISLYEYVPRSREPFLHRSLMHKKG